MSTLNVMEEELEILLKRAMANLQEDGFLVPIAFAFTSTSEIITIPGNELRSTEDTKEWADLIRDALAKFDAQFYVTIAESWVRRENTLVDGVCHHSPPRSALRHRGDEGRRRHRQSCGEMGNFSQSWKGLLRLHL